MHLATLHNIFLVMQSYSDSEIKKVGNFHTICKRYKKHQRRKWKCIIKTTHIPELQQKRLFDAIKLNDVERVIDLLRDDVDPNARDLQCRSALHIACSKGYCNIVSLLLEYGANPNIRDIMQNTPLHLAACTSNLYVIEILIRGGADIRLLDKHGKTPLQLAESKMQIMKHNWKSGAVEMKPIRAQMQQVIILYLI